MFYFVHTNVISSFVVLLHLFWHKRHTGVQLGRSVQTFENISFSKFNNYVLFREEKKNLQQELKWLSLLLEALLLKFLCISIYFEDKKIQDF